MTAQGCVFCDIIAGGVAASRVYEDHATIAFVDLRQPTTGHLLVVPKEHVETVYDLTPAMAAHLAQVVVVTARAMRRTLRPAGLSIWQSNGVVAGQEVPHVHLHLLVREQDDELLRVYPAKPLYPERAALDDLAATIRAGFGVPGHGG